MKEIEAASAAPAPGMKLDSRLPKPPYQRPAFEKTAKGLLQDAIATFPANRGSAICKVQRLRTSDPVGISPAAVELLESAEANSRLLQDAAGLLITCSLLVDLFMNARIWPLEAAVVVAQKILSVEPRLDVRLVKQVLGKVESVGSIQGEDALRLLGLVDAISDCSVLASYLIQFQRHPSDRVRSKAALMLGRSNCNPGRVELLLSSEDDRIRANAVQSLWGQRSKAALKIFWDAAQDQCARVVANALLGLCRAGDEEAPARLAQLADDPDPAMRRSGAWAMGETGDLQFLELLEKLVRDPVAEVRERAEKSRLTLVAKIPPAPAIEAEAPQKADTAVTAPAIEQEVAERPVAEPEEDQAPENEEPESEVPPNGWMTGRRTTYVRIA